MARTGLYNMVDPRRNILGEVVRRPLPKYDPLGLTVQDVREVDRVLEEVTRIAIATQSISGAPMRRLQGLNRIDLAQVPYSESQSVYDRWLELTGTVEINGRTLREELARVMTTRDYQTAPDGELGATPRGTKASIIREVISGYREAAREQFPELREIIREEREGTGRLLLEERAANLRQNPTRTLRNSRSFDLFPNLTD